MRDINPDNKRIARNSIFLSLRMIVVLGISIYLTRATLSILGVTDFGIYNVVCGFVSMFLFLNTSMANSIQRFFNYEFGKNDSEGANSVFTTAMLVQSALAIVVLILTETFGLWYLHYKMVIPQSRLLAADCIFQFSIFSFICVIFQSPFTAAVLAHEKMDFYALISVIDILLKLVIVSILPIVKYDSLIIYGFLLSIISLLDLLIYVVYCKCNFAEIKVRRTFSKSSFRSMLSFTGWNLTGSLSSVLREQGINLIINLFCGPVINAARGVATQINNAIVGLVQNLSVPSRPQVIQSYAQGNTERMINITYSVSKLCCCVASIIVIPLSYEMDYILNMWLGTNNVPAHTQSFAIIVLITSFQGMLNAPISTIIHATGNIKRYQLWGSCIKMISVPCAYFLLKLHLAPEYALLSVLVFDYIGHYVCLIITRQQINISLKDYIKRVLLPLIPTILVGCIVSLIINSLFEDGLVQFVMAFLLSIVASAIVSFYICLTLEEKRLISQFVPLLSRYNKL